MNNVQAHLVLGHFLFALHTGKQNPTSQNQTKTQTETWPCSVGKLVARVKKINNEGFHSNPSSVVQIDDFHSVLLYNQGTDILLKVLDTDEVILLKSLMQS